MCVCVCVCVIDKMSHLYKMFAKISQSDLRLTKMIVLGMPTGLPSVALFNLFRRDTRVLSFSWFSMHMMCWVIA